jgi:hypothetical protein
MLLSVGLGTLTFALGRFFDAFGIYLAPAGKVIVVVGPIIPDSVVYWLIPNGGAPAGVLLVVISAMFFWTVLFGGVHFAWTSLGRRRT